MRALADLFMFLLSLTLIASCSAPPKPPTVDEANRRPANSAAGVEFQVCRTELQNAQLLAAESGRAAQANAATMALLSARQRQLAALITSKHGDTGANRVFVITFDLGSSRVTLQSESAALLVQLAQAAPLVVLRGRTDGVADSLADSRLARDRAASVRDYLVAAGVDPSRIRTSHQPAGDHIADNTDSSGRSMNRRVEVEVYNAQPARLVTLR